MTDIRTAEAIVVIGIAGLLYGQLLFLIPPDGELTSTERRTMAGIGLTIIIGVVAVLWLLWTIP